MTQPQVIRMEDELHLLEIKIDALDAWVGRKESFNTLDAYEKQDMRDQLFHMRQYAAVLERRIGRAVAEHR
jgi:hypothetical protein